MTDYRRGDVVMTRNGLPYTVRSIADDLRGQKVAKLSPLQPGPGRHATRAASAYLRLVRTAELSMCLQYLDSAERDGVEPWQRERDLRWADHWLGKAMHRNDDTQDELHRVSDRLMDHERQAA
jgi:hypothetical protein